MLKGIFVVAGHGLGPTGKKDMGVMGNGTNERKEVLEIAQELGRRIVTDKALAGVELILIDGSFSVQEKAEQVEVKMRRKGWTRDDACLVDIHVNASSDTSARGIETWYGKNDDPAFAHLCQEELIKATNFPARKVLSSDKNRLGRLGILDDTTPNSCLAECGFLSNEFDAKALKDTSFDPLFAIGLHKAIRRQCGLAADMPGPGNPSDIPESAWYAGSVRRLKEIGVFENAEDGLFHPEAPVNRAQLAVALDRLLSHILSKLP